MTIDLQHIQGAADWRGRFANNYLVTYVMQSPAEDPRVHLGFGENAGGL